MKTKMLFCWVCLFFVIFNAPFRGVSQNSANEFSLSSLVIPQLERYAKYVLPFDSTLSVKEFYVDSSFIWNQNLVSYAYTFLSNNRSDTTKFMVAFAINQKMEYYLVHFCVPETKRKIENVKFLVDYEIGICGCHNANHSTISPTDYYKGAVPFKIKG